MDWNVSGSNDLYQGIVGRCHLGRNPAHWVGQFERREEESPVVRHRALEFGAWLFILFAVGRVGELIPGLAALPLVKIILGGTLIALISNWKSLPRFSKPRYLS